MARMMIFMEIVPLGIDFLRMLRHEMKIEDPIMKMNQGKTRSATVNPTKNKRRTLNNKQVLFYKTSVSQLVSKYQQDLLL